jgi:hypothetical protein
MKVLLVAKLLPAQVAAAGERPRAGFEKVPKTKVMVAGKRGNGADRGEK